MTFETQITRLPNAFDDVLAREAVEMFGEAGAQTRALLGGAAGCSPYLSGLMSREREWLLSALDQPETALSQDWEALKECDLKALPDALRRSKRRVALLTGLADLGGIWPLEVVTRNLTEFADLAVHLAMRATVGAEIGRGKLPGKTAQDAELAGGMTALAMGKMGAFELNYSSDVDLICLFDETQFEQDDFHDARASLVRATRRMSAMLSDLTGEGYVFRTDLRLRPDPAVTPVCMAMEAAERYYESLGRTWERAAYIKARPCAGDIAAGERFLKTLTPFIWRKHLDFAAIQDAHDMRLKYREHKGVGGPIKLMGHNMKLGRGGIREIEFFAQTQQIIAGGRAPELRLRGTVETLAKLAQTGWVPPETAQTLTEHYRFHREVEHRLQMLRDQQTHSLPTSDEEMDRLACFMGRDSDELKRDIKDRLEEVHALTEGFFAPDAPEPVPEQSAHSFDRNVIDRWQSYPALRSERAVEIFERLKPEILGRLAKSARPDEALLAFDGFLSGLPAGVQLFSLFDANPQLIDLLVDIVGTAPALARHLSRNSGVFDAVIGGQFFGEWPGVEGLSEELSAHLSRFEDYERLLDATRRWAKEWHFGIGVHYLRGLVDARAASQRYGELAEACLKALWPHVVAQFASKHGPQPGRGAAILGMGSLGAGQLNASSDLDLIVIYDPEDCEMSEGRRPLAVRQYYARLTQAMVTAVSAPMSEGRLYEVDMRLRPSGTQGPVATSWQSFSDYQANSAWMWEHLALTRARVVAGSDGLGDDIEGLRRQIVGRARPKDEVLRAVGEMMARIDAAKSGSPWDVKIGPGRIQQIELFAQAALLGAGRSERSTRSGIRAALDLEWIDAAQADVLEAALDLFWPVQMASRLLSEAVLDDAVIEQHIGVGGVAMLLRETGSSDLGALRARLRDVSQEAADVLRQVLPAPEGEV